MIHDMEEKASVFGRTGVTRTTAWKLANLLFKDRGGWRNLPVADGIDLCGPRPTLEGYRHWQNDPRSQEKIARFMEAHIILEPTMEASAADRTVLFPPHKIPALPQSSE